jgi:hypothetical protein
VSRALAPTVVATRGRCPRRAGAGAPPTASSGGLRPDRIR